MAHNHVCNARHVKLFDNALRGVVHNPLKIFGPYVKPGDSILDVGCGAGFTTMALARLAGENGHVSAADLQQEMLDMVRARAEKAGLNGRIDYHICAPDDIGITGPFDFANAFWMIHEAPDTGVFLRQIFNVLAPGGLMLAVEPKFHVSAAAFQKMIETALSAGFILHDRPRVRFSLAAALQKPMD